MSSPTISRSLKAENQLLRAQIQQLQTDRAAGAEAKERADADAQSQVRFRTLFEHSPLGQKIINPDLTIRQANAALVAMLGCTRREQVEGRRILDFAHPHYRADWHDLQERLWKHHIPVFSFDTCLVRTDGTSFWCQVHSMLFCDEGEELGYTTLIDTTEHRELEASLKRLYDAQETILHLVAHDLKTPIAHIQMLTELLRRDVGNPEPETPKLLALIEQACAEANALVKDVLYLGALDATQLKKESTNLNAFLEAQLTVHHLTAQAKGLALALELPPQMITAHLDPNKFSRVVANLLSNALKFTPRGGRVVVRLEAHAGRARLTVQDTGVGIAAELQTHIFDKFSAAARAGLHGEATTGLGLFITQQIVRLHGGTIGLTSREHEGTTFVINL
ncbi:PAS domain-containing sensor histidine kinase [Hymenobacter sp. H14-R3]|uniref:PAS domain-containing sensor histidine kinase n=1 Tax=Hymenobacter sp. H14-R3 TaxID=3046308 RepID=UPI0024BB7D3F|nr:PAS domain-containing sensor histidine kinase [Hymenobacter sp. H14-R3]MDJ0366527.1 PAS domain-containing sensor histidine kinase [Hymenobacter sp. H14-R3]